MPTSRDLNTGDILLFCGSNTSGWLFRVYDTLIRYFTHSSYTHTAIVLKSPTWINPKFTGTYVYESGVEPDPDPEDCCRKLGVQLTPLEEILNTDKPTVYVRKLRSNKRSHFDVDTLVKIHNDTHFTLYDFFPFDLLRAALQIQPDARYQHTDAMFCSALVSFMLVRCNLLPKDTDWSEVTPGDLSSSSNRFPGLRDSYENDVVLS